MANRRFFTPEQEDIVVAKYLDGQSYSSIGREHGTEHHTVRNTLMRLGVTPRSRDEIITQTARQRRIFSEDEELVVVKRYLNLETGPEIANAYGCSTAAVYDVLHRADVPLRRAVRLTERHPAAKGPAHHSWRTGRTIRDGYVILKIYPDDPMYVMATVGDRIREHRLVMARHLDRPLLPSETVHHIDGDTLNNDISNLQLRQGRHGRGIVLECADCGSHNLRPIPIADPEEPI